MKKTIFMYGFAIATLWGCGPDSNNETPGNISEDIFEFTVTEDAAFTNKLPKLQSFVFAAEQNNWLIFGGRTIGFHGFTSCGNGSDTCGANFPASRANDSIYVYDPDLNGGTLYSMAIPAYQGDTGNVLSSTNLQHMQQGKYLYACGGYGLANATDSFATVTYSYFMQINMPQMIQAVKDHNQAAFKQSIKWGNSPLVCATGGELYKLPDGNFYLVVGHKFTGTYLGTHQQVYLDKVNVFSVDTSGAQLNLTSVNTISDGGYDDTTQFRRRDLVVAPAVQSNGTDIGIAIYGGVFDTAGNPYHHPIYINYLNTPKYKIDPAIQYSNIYSTAFLCMYDSVSKSMMTSFFGGLGDDSANWSNANWTNYITTAKRSYANSGDQTTFIHHTNNLPGYFGGESIFIPASGLTYSNDNYKIINYNSLHDTQVVGYIYGGIHSADSGGSSTWSSNVVYKVTFNKLVPLK